MKSITLSEDEILQVLRSPTGWEARNEIRNLFRQKLAKQQIAFEKRPWPVLIHRTLDGRVSDEDNDHVLTPRRFVEECDNEAPFDEDFSAYFSEVIARWKDTVIGWWEDESKDSLLVGPFEVTSVNVLIHPQQGRKEPRWLPELVIRGNLYVAGDTMEEAAEHWLSNRLYGNDTVCPVEWLDPETGDPADIDWSAIRRRIEDAEKAEKAEEGT